MRNVLVGLSLVIATLVTGAGAHAEGETHDEGSGEVKLSLARTRTALLVPTFSLLRESLNFSDGLSASGANEKATAQGVEVGVRFLSSSTSSRNFFAGLDLRQSWERGGGDMFSTKLGLRLELHPRALPRFGFSFNWFFGDTFVARQRDRQFNGSTFALGTSVQTGDVRWLLEGTMGTYKEGPGFIIRSREAGIEGLDTWGVKIGAELPIEIPMPDFLYSGPPS